MQNLIKFDCQNLYSRVCVSEGPVQQILRDLYECIVDATQTTHSRYNQSIGYLCAHTLFHYSSED